MLLCLRKENQILPEFDFATGEKKTSSVIRCGFQNSKHSIIKHVYDKDRFSFDDKMGEAEFDINPFIEAVKMRLKDLPDGTIVTRIPPNRQNCLAEESHILWKEGKVVQNMVLRLKNVVRGSGAPIAMD
ncbi:hypothetical protein K1719_024330 [Acacia pycnantha]|nr:hypothetical protein K1719_024330 [Acacia pycnantha]